MVYIVRPSVNPRPLAAPALPPDSETGAGQGRGSRALCKQGGPGAATVIREEGGMAHSETAVCAIVLGVLQTSSNKIG